MYHNLQSYEVWFLRYWAWRTKFFCHFGQFFAHLTCKNPKNQNFEKMKKAPGDITLQKCTKDEDHMLYCSWDMACDGCNCYFSFWTIFCLFTPITAWKVKISKKWKKKTPGDVIILHKCTKNYDHIVYCSWDMARERCNCYFSFCAIFCAFTPPSPLPPTRTPSSLTCSKNEKWKKMKKTPRDIIILHKYTKNHDMQLFITRYKSCELWTLNFLIFNKLLL